MKMAQEKMRTKDKSKIDGLFFIIFPNKKKPTDFYYKDGGVSKISDLSLLGLSQKQMTIQVFLLREGKDGEQEKTG